MDKLIQSMNRNRLKWQPADNSQQVQSLRNNIESIRMELLQVQIELQNEKKSMNVLVTEWIALLVSIVQNGYFMPDGLKSVLLQMTKY